MDFNLMRQRVKEIGPILRRFFINTLFDSTFTQLGIITGSAIATNPDLRIIIGTLVASSVALGISTGVSVYESESLERERRIVELEKALFRDLKDTVISEKYEKYVMIISVVNFFTPLICCSIVIIPLFLVEFQLLNLTTASWISIALALTLLFLAGTYLGRLGRQNPFWKGTRMVIFGVSAFVIGYIIQILI